MGDDKVVTEVRAAGSGETLGKDAAFEVTAGELHDLVAVAGMGIRIGGADKRLYVRTAHSSIR